MRTHASDHIPEFDEAAASDRAREVLLAATEALACTAADVLLSADLRERAWSGHRAPATGER